MSRFQRLSTRLGLVFGLILLLALMVAVAPALANGGRPLTAILTGAAEVPNPGDPDGSGFAHLTFNPGQGQVCWHISVEDIDLPATAAHIHIGAAGVPGGVVVTLSPPDESGTSSGCTEAARDLILEIMKNPDGYYVNVHNAVFPGGAVRGQLTK